VSIPDARGRPGAASSWPSQQPPGPGSGIKDHGLRSGYACQEAARTPGTGSPPAGFCSPGWPGMSASSALCASWRPCILATTRSRARSSLAWAPARSAGVRPAGPIRWPWRGCGSGFFPGVRSVAARGTSFSLLSWPQRALGGGARPDLLDVVAWWQADDFWRYALFAAVAYIRAAADRAGARAPGMPGTGPASWPAVHLMQPVLGKGGRALCSERQTARNSVHVRPPAAERSAIGSHCYPS
jgi:hypothetical protein